MTASPAPDDERIAELLQLEEQRCRAIAEEDLVALELLLDDDLTFTHMNGHVHDKAGFLAARARGPRFTTQQHGLKVRLSGDVAVMSGGQLLDVDGMGQIEAQVSQVWVRRGPTWRQSLFHATRVQAD